MATAVDDRDDDVPVVLPGLRFGRGHRLLGLIKPYRRAIVTNTFMNGGLRRSDALAAGKFHFEPPSRFTSLDHLVGGDEQSIWYFEAKRLCGLEVDHELELCRQHNRQITRLIAFEDASGINAGLTVCIVNAGRVAHQTADLGSLARNRSRESRVGPPARQSVPVGSS